MPIHLDPDTARRLAAYGLTENDIVASLETLGDDVCEACGATVFTVLETCDQPAASCPMFTKVKQFLLEKRSS